MESFDDKEGFSQQEKVNIETGTVIAPGYFGAPESRYKTDRKSVVKRTGGNG